MTSELLTTLRRALHALEEGGLAKMGQIGYAASVELRAEIEQAETRETLRKLKAMNKKTARGLANGSLTLDGRPHREAR